MGTLYIIATPIGNLEDITLRALRILKEVDVVLCEDTRVTRKLLKHYEIDTTRVRCDAATEHTCAKKAITLLQDGKRIGYVSDAGTPGISDPGPRLVSGVRDALPECAIVTVPGASALTSALSIAGIPYAPFLFLGFLPHKKGRETLFAEIAYAPHTVIFYESPHRIEKTLESLAAHLGDAKQVYIGRELTKVHEEMLVGTAGEILALLRANPQKVRGELVVIVK